MAKRKSSVADEIAELLMVLPPGASIELRNGRPVIVPRETAAVAEPPPTFSASHSHHSDLELQRVIASLKSPKRQTKIRVMPMRRAYSLAKISSARMIEELQKSVESCQQVIVYLIDHPRQTVADLATALDLSRKTIENQLTDLRKRELLITDESPRRRR